MKILQITIYPNKGTLHTGSGGVASYSKNLTNNLNKIKNSDDKLYVVCNKNDKNFDYYKEENVTVIRAFDKNPSYVLAIIKTALKINPDIVHIQQELKLYGNILTALMLPLLIALLRIKYKVIVTIHGVVTLQDIDINFIVGNYVKYPIEFVKLGFYILYKTICIFSNKVIVHEEIFKDILIKDYSVNKNKIKVVPHGIEEVNLKEVKISNKFNFPKDKKIFLFMGYLTGYKGIDLLIEGFEELLKRRNDVYLVIASGKHPKQKNNPEYLKQYKQYINKAKKLLGNKNHKWIGYVEEDDIGYLYTSSFATIFPYSNNIASSGPMSLSIGYEVPFLCSSSFKKVFDDLVIFNSNPVDYANKIDQLIKKDYKNIKKYTIELKNNRSWKNTSINTYNIYKQTYEKDCN